jgi:glycosyltransferase involved in cell wall biosynthesis
MREKISIIVPVYNEGLNVSDVVREIVNSMRDSKYEHEVIVVDDASTDDTAHIAAGEGVKVIRHEINRGYGASLKSGIINSDGEFVAIIDGDGSYSARDLLVISDFIQDNDMVVGARTKPGAKISLPRKIDKFFLTLLASYLVETRIPDLNSGLRIIRRDRLGKFMKILPNKFSFTTTITIAFLDSNLKVKFIPVDYRKRRRGRSKIRPIHDTLNFIQLIIKTVMYFNPLKVFIPISLFFFLCGLAVFFYSLFFMPKVMDITTVILFVASIQIIAIGMIADVIIKRTE